MARLHERLRILFIGLLVSVGRVTASVTAPLGCETCLDLRGSCEDSDLDGTYDTCVCQEPYLSTSLAAGCDKVRGCEFPAPGTVIEGEVSGTVDWPPGDNPYTTLHNCAWTIVAPEGKVIRYRFSSFGIDAADDFNIFASLTSSRFVSASYNSDYDLAVKGETSVTGGQYLGLVFSPTNNNTLDPGFQGFVLEWEVADSECIGSDGEYTLVSAELDPGLDYPTGHTVHANLAGSCHWQVHAPEGKIIKWRVDQIDFGSNYDNKDYGDDLYDWLYATDNERYYYMNSDKGGIGAYTDDGSFLTRNNVLYLEFYANYKYNDAGFQISWGLHDAECFECLHTSGDCSDGDLDGTPDTCTCPAPYFSTGFDNGCDRVLGCESTPPGVVTVNDPSGTLEWPAGGGMYQPNHECYWRIVAPEGKVIRYAFEQLSIEDYDYLHLGREGRGFTDYNSYFSFMADLDLTSVSVENVLDLAFVSDSVDYYSHYSINPDILDGWMWGRYGFTMHWEVVDPECSNVTTGKAVSAEAGGLDYPASHDKYAHGLDMCVWRIEAPTGKIISWSLDEIAIGNSYDTLYFFNTDPEFAVWGWDAEYEWSTDGSWVSSGNVLMMALYTDWYSNERGFQMTWTIYDEVCYECLRFKGWCEDQDSDGTPDTCVCQPPYNSSSLELGCDMVDGCNSSAPGVITEGETSGTIDWPPGNNVRRPDLDCYWTINAPEGKVIRYRFAEVGVDIVTVVNSPGAHEVYGNKYGFIGDKAIGGNTTVSASNYLQIRMISGSSEDVPDRDDEYGFVLEWEVVEPECDQTEPGIELDAAVGRLDYPANHDFHANNLYTCNWRVLAPEGKIFKWRLESMDVELFYEWLIVYNDDDPADWAYYLSGGGQSSTETYDGDFLTDSNVLNFAFYSEYLNNNEGFVLSWDLVDAACLTCYRTNGVCEDADSDGSPDTCTCTDPYISTALENGCDWIKGCDPSSPGVLIDGNPSGSLEWPPGPGVLNEYLKNMDCYWRITAPEGKVIRYKFIQSSIEPEDYLYVHTAPGAEPSWHNYWFFPDDCLDKTTATLDNFMNLHFKSDDVEYYDEYILYYNYEYYYDYNYTYYTFNLGVPEEAADLTWTRFGFTLEWEIVDPECVQTAPGVVVDSSVGSLDYPLGHDKYAHNMNMCYWKIVAPEGKAFKYHFTLFDLTDEPVDYLLVFEDDNISDFDEFSGGIIPANENSYDGSFVTVTNILNLAMYTDYLRNYEGFVIEWEVIDGVCSRCIRDGGVCLDLDSDGTSDTCMCPPELCAATLGAGCTDKCELVNAMCQPSSPRPCWDHNAECVMIDVFGMHACRCKFGYVAVYVTGEPVRCHRRLSFVQDGSCETCVQNGGTCYDVADAHDSVMDGCQCPPTRATENTPCDTDLFEVNCTMTGMSICYKSRVLPEDPELAEIAEKLNIEDNLLFVRGFVYELGCHMLRDGDDYCITLNYGDPHCGLQVSDGMKSRMYTSTVVLQKNAYQETMDDLCLLAYCTYDRILDVSSAVVDVLDTKHSGTEGEIHQADLAMLVLDEVDADLRTIGIITGDVIKMRLSIVDDAGGLFTSLRPEVCVVSDRLTLTHPEARTVPVILDSCPEPPLLESDDNFRPLDGDLTLQETGLFTSPTFSGSAFLFAHCAVRVCMDDTNCQPKACESPERRRRRSVRSEDTVARMMEDVLRDATVQHEYIAIRFVDSKSGENLLLPHEKVDSFTGNEAGNLTLWLSIVSSCVIIGLVLGVVLGIRKYRTRTGEFPLKKTAAAQ